MPYFFRAKFSWLVFFLSLFLVPTYCFGQNINLQIQKGDVTCFGGNNGILNVQVINTNNCGPGPYKYAIFSGGSTTPLSIQGPLNFGTQASFTGLTAGIYDIQVWDAWNDNIPTSVCETAANIQINQPSVLSATTSNTNIICNNAETGSILITVNGGTTGSGSGNSCKGYNISWTGATSGGDANCICSSGNPSNCVIEIATASPSLTTNQFTMSNLPAGTYNISITDFSGCTLNIIRTITQPNPITPTFSIASANCVNGTGSITVGGLDATDGTPSNVGFNVSWQLAGGSLNNPAGVEIPAPGFPQFPINNLSPGVYAITITDNNGCVNSSQQTVGVANPSPIIAGNNQICQGSTSQLTVTNNQPPVSGTPWSSSNTAVAQVSSTGVVTAISAGISIITFTSSTGCIGTYTVTVNPSPVFNLSPPVSFCAGSSATLTATSVPSSNVFNYQWSTTPTFTQNGVSTSSVTVSPTATTTFSVTATNASTGCSTTSLTTVTVNPLNTPLFTQLGPYCQNATPGTLSNISNNGIAGTWSPSTVNTSVLGTTVYTFTPTSSAFPTCAVNTTMSITVATLPTATINGTTSVCQNSSQPIVTFTGSTGATTTPPYTFSYTVSGTATTQTITTSSTNSSVTLPVSTSTPGNYTYTLTNVSIGSCSNIITNQAATITVTANQTPAFTQLGPYCSGNTITLPTLSTNGFTGTWSPAVNNSATSSSVSTTYTFTPTPASGVCATTAQMTIVVNPNIVPTFNPLGPYCQNTTPGTLPTTSNNGISGTWSPSTISTNTIGTQTYNFTPTTTGAPGCAQNASMAIQTTTLPTATISGTTNVCQNSSQPNVTFTGATGATTTPPYTFTYTINGGSSQTITTSSTNSSVTLPVSTSTPGNYTYTLTNVSIGSCSNIITNQAATITVTANQTPAFSQLGPYCSGNTITLPTLSTNGFIGTWSPAVNNSATTSAVTTNYTFTPTPASGVCATTAQMAIVVNPNIVPTFNPLGPYCQNTTPGTLPTTSNNGISGTWSPSTIFTNTIGTQTYNFTPTTTGSPGCAQNASMTIQTTTLPTATITGTTNICQNSSQPVVTFTGQTGNTTTPPYTFTYTINGGSAQTITTSSTSSSVSIPVPTGTPGTFTYSITNVAIGSCSNTVSGNAVITVSANQIPTFTQLGSFCSGNSFSLPTLSNNGFAGTWSPAVNNIATTSPITTTYTFTPTSGAGICATTANMAIVVNPNTTPIFTQLGPYCQGATPATLPLTSNNGIAGTWSPSTISTTTAGTITYTFTPTSTAPNTCATSTTMSIVVTTLPSATIQGTTVVCENGAQPNITFTGLNSTA
ncbi:MAG: hypothetical protein RL264_1334, partial [Bacteroidota bacterium]